MASTVLFVPYSLDSDDRLEGVPREQKTLKGHLPRVIYHQVYSYTKCTHVSLTTIHLNFSTADISPPFLLFNVALTVLCVALTV